MKLLFKGAYASDAVGCRQQNYDCGYAFPGITELRINHETSQTTQALKKPDESDGMSTSTQLDDE